MCLVVTCWERADLLALVCGVELWVCHFPIGVLGQVWYLIVSIPDSLHPYLLCKQKKNTKTYKAKIHYYLTKSIQSKITNELLKSIHVVMSAIQYLQCNGAFVSNKISKKEV